MSQPHCVLCDEPAGQNYRQVSMTPEARSFYKKQFPGADPDSILAINVICARCHALPADARQVLAREAVTREIESFRKQTHRELFSERIDVGRTIELVALSDETWAWLNLIGYIVRVTQSQAGAHDANAT